MTISENEERLLRKEEIISDQQFELDKLRRHLFGFRSEKRTGNTGNDQLGLFELGTTKSVQEDLSGSVSATTYPIKKNSDGDIVLFTDKNTAYSHIEDIVETHFTVVSGKDATNDTLKWVHKAISNPKRKLLGINHMITYKYLQNYLNEFVYKLNRRYFGNKSFKEISKEVSGITERMLSKELKDLEDNQLVRRTVYDSFPPKVEYSITEHGKSLSNVIDELKAWGLLHRKKIMGR